jgi:hypothetical protein
LEAIKKAMSWLHAEPVDKQVWIVEEDGIRVRAYLGTRFTAGKLFVKSSAGADHDPPLHGIQITTAQTLP